MKEPILLLLNLSVLFESLGGSPPECPGPAKREQRGSTCQHTGEHGTYRPSVSTILITSSYEEQNCTSAPGLQLSLERAPVPEGDDAAAASQGQGMLNSGEVGPKRRDLI